MLTSKVWEERVTWSNFEEELAAETNGKNWVVAQENSILLVPRRTNFLDFVYELPQHGLLPACEVSVDQDVQHEFRFWPSSEDLDHLLYDSRHLENVGAENASLEGEF